MDIQKFKDDLAAEVRALETSKCPQCGTRNFTHTSHPATGVMVTCKCGLRSYLSDFLKGIHYLQRNEKGTYDVTEEYRNLFRGKDQ